MNNWTGQKHTIEFNVWISLYVNRYQKEVSISIWESSWKPYIATQTLQSFYSQLVSRVGELLPRCAKVCVAFKIETHNGRISKFEKLW